MCGYLSLWTVYWVFKLLTKKEGMGYGDFKLFAAFGAWFGWRMLLPIILFASLVGSVVGVYILYRQRKGLVLFVRLHGHRTSRPGERGCQGVDACAIGKERLVLRIAFEHPEYDFSRRSSPLDDLQQLSERDQALESMLELLAGHLGSVGQHNHA